MRFVPDTIAGRTIAVLLSGLLGLHLASIWAYQLGLDTQLSLTNAARTAERLVSIRDTLAQLPPEQREATAHSLSGGPLEVHYSSVPLAVSAPNGNGRLSELRSEISSRAGDFGSGGLMVGAPADGSGTRTDPHLTLVSLKLADGGWVNANVAVLDGPHSSMRAILISTALMGVGVLAIALAMVGSVTQPIRRCAREAQRVYVENEPQPIPVDGPKEVRDLARAFNEMQHRVKRMVDERSLTLAAISHDLKSPLARVRLRIEELEDEGRRRDIEADLDEMLQMIDSSLDFLKPDHGGEDLQRIDMGAIVGSICDDISDRGHAVTLHRQGRAVVQGRRLALKRAFTNLIGNAIKYGMSAGVTVTTEQDTVTVTIVDEGPGIPEDELERVFAPFYRVETSRSRETGGVGLGLTVAHTVITAHGGTLKLSNRPEGGLKAVAALPKSSARP